MQNKKRIDPSIAVKLIIYTQKDGVGPLCHITSKTQLKGNKTTLLNFP